MNRVRKNRVQRLDPVQRSENWKRIIKKEESYAITNDMSKIRTARDSNNSDALRTALGGGLETTRSTNKRPPSPTSTVMSSVSTRSSRTGVSSASFRTSTTTIAMRKIDQLENVLKEERTKREKAEKELSELRAMVENLMHTK